MQDGYYVYDPAISAFYKGNGHYSTWVPDAYRYDTLEHAETARFERHTNTAVVLQIINHGQELDMPSPD